MRDPRWPSSASEACCGVGYGDELGIPRTVRECTFPGPQQVYLTLFLNSVATLVQTFGFFNHWEGEKRVPLHSALSFVVGLLGLILYTGFFVSLLRQDFRHLRAAQIAFVVMAAVDTGFLIFVLASDRAAIRDISFDFFTVASIVDIALDLYMVFVVFNLRRVIRERGVEGTIDHEHDLVAYRPYDDLDASSHWDLMEGEESIRD